MAIMYRADSIIPDASYPADIEEAGDMQKEIDVSDTKNREHDTELPVETLSYEEKNKSLNAKGWTLAFLTFQAVGVVYGDIGTSPLYVLNGIFVSVM
jgi:hypothetical protein